MCSDRTMPIHEKATLDLSDMLNDKVSLTDLIDGLFKSHGCADEFAQHLRELRTELGSDVDKPDIALPAFTSLCSDARVWPTSCASASAPAVEFAGSTSTGTRSIAESATTASHVLSAGCRCASSAGWCSSRD